MSQSSCSCHYSPFDALVRMLHRSIGIPAARYMPHHSTDVLTLTWDQQADFNALAGELAGENARFCFCYDEPLSHLIYAACDILLVPSMFEPCGLTQVRSKIGSATGHRIRFSCRRRA